MKPKEEGPFALVVVGQRTTNHQAQGLDQG